MTTYYLDPENGNDNNNGTSFAQRTQTLTSIKSSLAAGDSVRMIGSPDPTSLGSGAVRKRDCAEGYYGTNFKSNSISFNTTTGQTTIVWSETTSGGVQRGHNLTTGDVVGIYGNSNSYGNINGTWDVTVVDYQTFKLDGFTATSSGTGDGGYFTNMTGRLVRLASAATQTIACTGARTATWTASSNVTTPHATNTSPVWSQQGKVIEHDRSDEIVWNSSFTTGKAAYFQLPSALNLSGYEQISLYIKNTQNGGLNPGHFSLRLCTDTTGDTSVHTIDLTQRGSGNYYWSTIVKDFGSALNSSIQSVALYVDRNEGASGVRLSNIIACKAKSSADSITHESLIGLNTTDDPDWFAIESIVGDRVLLHGTGRKNMTADLPIGYYYRGHSLSWSASNSSTTIYKRECIRADLSVLTTNDLTNSYNWNDFSNTSGSNGNPITLSGGWDRTSMSSQNLSMSYINYVLDEGRAFYCNYANFWSISKIGVVNAGYGLHIQNSNRWTEISDVAFVSCGSNGLDISQMHDYGLKKLTVTHSNQNGYRGVYLNQTRFKASNGISATSWDTEARYDEDRDNFKIRSTSNAQGNIYLSNQYVHMPMVFKYLQADAFCSGITSISVYNHSAPLEVETADVRQGLPEGDGGIKVFGTSTGTKTFHTVNAQNSKKILSCENTGAKLVADTVNGDVTYGPQNWPGGYPSDNSPCIYVNDGEVHIKTAGTFKGRVQGHNNGKFFLNNTTGQFIYGGNLWVLYQTSSVYLKNSLGETMAYYTGSYNYIKPDTSNRRTNSGYAWKFYAPNPGSPLSHYVAKVAVNSGSQASISVYVRWDGYSGPTKLGLRVDGSEVGLSDSLTGYWSSGSYSYQQVTVNFTPTIAGYVDVYLECEGNGGSTFAYFDDMSATQA